MEKRFRLQLPLLVWAALIFLGSSLPSVHASRNSVVDFVVHKSVHLFEYGVLYLLYYLSVARNFWEIEKKKVFYGLFFVFLYGVTDEFHQRFVPGRGSHAVDVLIDTLGGFLGFVLWKFLRQRALQRRKI
ncbi:MAG: VanZ family protein [Patescibacteria group bacterium]|nr:VanZ family protein [Patescibacteria group bacterium]